MSHASIPSLRTDALTGREVIIASDRGQRPGAIQTSPPLTDPIDGDPFLEGSESETPGEVLALRKSGTRPNEPGWLVRVIPNRFPALSASPQPLRSSDHPLLQQTSAFGIHDVVIETNDNRRQLTELSNEEFARVLTAWQKRIARLNGDSRIAALAVFRNEGFQAGASLPHVHSQIVGSNSVPDETATRHRRSVDYRNETGRELLDDLCAAERHLDLRIVRDGDHLLILCPFASRVAWQVRFVPQCADRVSFANTSPETILELAAGIQSVVVALSQCVGPFAFNLTLIQPPVNHVESAWYFELLPRTARQAGFELATNVDIITTAPEQAAGQLRERIVWAQPESVSVQPVGYEWMSV